MNYVWFASESGCGLNIALITLSILSGLVYSILSITIVENGCNDYIALLTSACVNFYVVYLTWDALLNDPGNCNTWDKELATGTSILIGSVIILLLLLIVSLKKEQPPKDGEIASKATNPILPENEGTAPPEDKESYSEESSERRMVYFMLFMMVCSVYLSMLLTNWGSPAISAGGYSR